MAKRQKKEEETAVAAKRAELAARKATAAEENAALEAVWWRHVEREVPPALGDLCVLCAAVPNGQADALGGLR